MAIEEINGTNKGLTPYAPKNNERVIEPIPLPRSMRPAVFKMLARWGTTENTYNRIADIMLEEFNMVVTPDDLRRLAKAYPRRISDIRAETRAATNAKVDEIMTKTLNKTHALMQKQLDRSFRDAEKLEALEVALEAGSIDKKEFKRATALLKPMSMGDLIKLANYIQPHTPQLPPPTPLPEPAPTNVITDGNSAPESALSKQLADAVARGDQVEVQRIVWSQKGSAQSSSTPETTEESHQ